MSLPFLASFAFGQDTIDLRFRPKINEVRKFESTTSLEIAGTKVEFSIKQSNKVLEVAENGDVKQENTTTEQKLLVNGEEQDQPMPPATTNKRSAKGDVLELSTPVPNPLSQCITFMRTIMLPDAPVKIGDKWSREFKANDKLGYTACSLKYELLSKDKVGDVDIAKVKVQYANDDKGTATGEIWVRISDGTTFQLDAKIDGLSPAAGAPDATGTVKIKLTSG